MKKIYLFSGLGADERVFQFLDLHGFDPVHIQWVPCVDHEDITRYARRLLPQIQSQRPLLIGVSFGGMLAQEVAKLIETEKIILISSATQRGDILQWVRFSGTLNLHRLVPAFVFKWVNPITHWLFGTHTASERKLLRDIVRQTDVRFLKWAIGCIARWKNRNAPSNAVRVHGTADRLLTCRQAELLVPGGHFIVVSHAAEISKFIKDHFS